jgi:hypothetical protein
MITMPMSTPSPISPAVTRKSEFPPLAAGAPEALAAEEGLATATTDRVGTAVVLIVGAAVVGAAVVGAAERVAVGLAAIVGTPVVAAVGLAPVVVAGDGEVVLVPRDAQARESLTPGADAQTDRAGVTHELPSAAVRESDTRMNG